MPLSLQARPPYQLPRPLLQQHVGVLSLRQGEATSMPSMPGDVVLPGGGRVDKEQEQSGAYEVGLQGMLLQVQISQTDRPK